MGKLIRRPASFAVIEGDFATLRCLMTEHGKKSPALRQGVADGLVRLLASGEVSAFIEANQTLARTRILPADVTPIVIQGLTELLKSQRAASDLEMYDFPGIVRKLASSAKYRGGITSEIIAEGVQQQLDCRPDDLYFFAIQFAKTANTLTRERANAALLQTARNTAARNGVFAVLRGELPDTVDRLENYPSTFLISFHRNPIGEQRLFVFSNYPCWEGRTLPAILETWAKAGTTNARRHINKLMETLADAAKNPLSELEVAEGAATAITSSLSQLRSLNVRLSKRTKERLARTTPRPVG